MNNKFEPNVLIDPFSLWLITTKGELKKLHCPFLARCIIPIVGLQENEIYVVDMINKDLKNIIIYITNGKPYLHHHFEVLV